jgi:tetratricopeptide (TPR) repeat protein
MVEASREAVTLLEPGNSHWLTAVACQLLGGTCVSDLSITAEAIQKVLTVPLRNEPSGAYGIALYIAIQGLTYNGEHETAEALLRRAEEIARTTEEADPAFSMWLCNARGYLTFLTDDLGRAFATLAEARVLAERHGGMMGRVMAAFFGIAALCQTGHTSRVDAAVQELIGFCGPGLRTMVDWATYFSAWTRIETGGGIEAIGPIWELLDRTDARLVTAVRVVIAQALLDAGDAAAAEQQAKLATAGALFPSNQAGAWGRRANIALHFERPREALDWAERGLEVAPLGAAQSTVSALRLARALALHALGRTDEARDAIREARARILRIAATLDDLELRASFSNGLRVNARTLALAREWLD